jgi:hypothetical protein
VVQLRLSLVGLIMAKVIKVNISGYYLIPELPVDVLGTATMDEYVQYRINEINNMTHDFDEIVELVETMFEDMKTNPTVRLSLKEYRWRQLNLVSKTVDNVMVR